MSDPRHDLSTLALTVFSLNGQFLSIAENIASRADLTATRWQVLGALVNDPLTQAEVARQMGITRQSVQRTSKQLIDEGMLETLENPSHQKAMLLQLTPKGHNALSKIRPFHKAYAEQLIDTVGEEKVAEMVKAITELSTAMKSL
ncbi:MULTISPECIES: MarR family winged helix-turn-helix transcriptional regulator [unclassified Vibrio]|jgi:DNA-binding MarR family transcriptional regulator|uniref:MarR family winged helix-turn-helix transcriptional regulator n=1 Tax=Vibrio TaxID=662 RepID=UPI000C83DE6C|nr:MULTISPECIES: MarR family winged helix-turn-helix transcriptional regulator [unclassified Vibrio]CAH7120592.1 Winged helix-turn-helix transcriptional regulator [Vibrio chagasii]MCG9552773.1 MarR family winged helix-turn-helix transcriptional regulator [Vibrio sp. Isolate32]MCG9601369.1 MarR family winged helix-turn-helix transcriptional regulator [Vibrio sp. Isolate31]MDA0155984.1 MarR family winged helix-turn-helix transcriptional regulator [Vibrio sp. Makdt]PMI21219.1 MarR family transcri